MVTHNGADWLPRALVALAGLNTRPARIIALDADSRDDSPQLLDRAVSEGILDACYSGPGDRGFGASVQRAISLDAEALRSAGHGMAPQWLWLLHDDLEPAHDALDELLRASHPGSVPNPAAANPAVPIPDVPIPDVPIPDVLVPKLLHPRLRNHADQMSALGESIAPNGARVPSVEPGDIDQHQLDPGPVLGGSSAGMFIRFDAWLQLGGFDPGIPLYRDGVDFGWRAQRAGLVVSSCPQAAFHHREAGRVGLRDSAVAPNAQISDTVAGMRVATAHADRPTRTARLIAAHAWTSALGYLVGKSPSRARDQIRAWQQFRASADTTMALRARVQAQSTGVALSPGLLPPRWWGVRHSADRWASGMGDAIHELRNDESSSGIDELTGSDYANVAVARRVLSARLVTVLVAVLTSLLAVRGLFGSDPLVAARLLPAPDSLSEAWSAWAAAVPGAHGANAPWLGLAALGSTLALGNPELFVLAWLACSVGLATWTSSHFFARVCGRGWFANGLALSWGLTLPVVGAISQGSIDLVAVAVIIPALGTSLLRWRQRPISGAEGWRVPGAVALETALLASFFPLLALAAMALAGVVAHGRHDGRGALVACAGPVVMLGPWLIRLATTPGRLLTGADPTAVVAAPAPGTLQALLGQGLGGNTPLWLAASFVALIAAGAVIGFLLAPAAELERRTRLVLAGGGAIALAMAVVLPHLVVPVAGAPVRPTGVDWYLVAIFLALALAGFGSGRPVPVHGERAQDRPLDRLLTRTQMIEGLIIAVTVLIGSLWWAIGGAGGSLHRAASPLPSYVSTVEQSPRDTRTLMVSVDDDRVDYSLHDADSPHWGDGELNPISMNTAMRDQVASLARQIAQGVPSDDMASRLAQLGVGHVWVRGASSEVRSSLGVAPGLSSAVADEHTIVWTLDGDVSRTAVRTAQDEVPVAGSVDDALSQGTLIVAEPASRSVHASIDGHSLKRTDSGDWRAAFELDGHTGELQWRTSIGWAGCAWQILALIAALVLIAPAASRGTNAPRRALNSTTRGSATQDTSTEGTSSTLGSMAQGLTTRMGAARRVADPQSFAIGVDENPEAFDNPSGGAAAKRARRGAEQ